MNRNILRRILGFIFGLVLFVSGLNCVWSSVEIINTALVYLDMLEYVKFFLIIMAGIFVFTYMALMAGAGIFIMYQQLKDL